jgi:creatinine amidohydrolase
MDPQERLSKSVSVVAERVEKVSAEVMRALSTAIDVSAFAQSDARWISTGAGASEGPARLLATLLRGRGLVADFVPISIFIDDAPPADVCVVVSQRLSPNARMPLARASAYRHMLLVTTLDDAQAFPSLGRREASHVRLVKHGPRDEAGLLLRLIGPAAATATILRLAADLEGFPSLRRREAALLDPSTIDAVENALATARARAEAAMVGINPSHLFDVVGLVGVGADVSLCEGLRHKLLEGLGRTHPPLWDLCAVVHGPLQSFYERLATLVLFERDGARAVGLASELGRVLDPARHRLVRLRSALPGPLALLDFDLQLDHLVLAALRARPRDLFEWPGKGRDAPLYDLGKEL